MSSSYQAQRYFVALGERYTNLWRAYDALLGTEYDVEPCVENEVFQNLKGTKIDLKRDYESECLKMLFDKYNNMSLLYSGGVDCHTIAVKAKQLGLKFNESLVIGQSLDPGKGIDSNHLTPGVQNFFREDPGFKFIPATLEWYTDVFLHNEWWYEDADVNLGPITKLHYIDEFKDDELYIAGMDKPWLLYHDSQWYLYYTHTGLMTLWDRPNVFYFFGLNDLLPELAVAQAQKARNFYIKTCGAPESRTKWVDFKMFRYGQDSNDFILGFNDAIDRISISKTHDLDQSFDNPVLSKRGIWRLHQLHQAGRGDVASHFLRTCRDLYNKYKQIDWEYPPYQPMGRIPWLLNIDTLEYVPGDQLGSMLNS